MSTSEQTSSKILKLTTKELSALATQSSTRYQPILYPSSLHPYILQFWKNIVQKSYSNSIFPTHSLVTSSSHRMAPIAILLLKVLLMNLQTPTRHLPFPATNQLPITLYPVAPIPFMHRWGKTSPLVIAPTTEVKYVRYFYDTAVRCCQGELLAKFLFIALFTFQDDRVSWSGIPTSGGLITVHFPLI